MAALHRLAVRVGIGGMPLSGLPDMDGNELARRLRQLPAMRDALRIDVHRLAELLG